eukprot:1613053-Pyramimonas_sp.AAC.1
MHSPSHDKDPGRCSWFDKGDYHWECPSFKKNYGNNKPGHVVAPRKCRFAKPWKLPDNHRLMPP